MSTKPLLGSPTSAWLPGLLQELRSLNTDNGAKYLVAVSGGADSVALVLLCKLAGLPITLAHVNYGLRGADSDADEAFVRQLAREHKLGLHLLLAQRDGEEPLWKTRKHVKGNTQLRARNIRHKWFWQLQRRKGYAGVLLAHHQDDWLETFFLNLGRGTGLRGLANMASERQPHLHRPLLRVSGQTIKGWLLQNGHRWREDKSNLQQNYRRNALRLQAIPALKQVLPQLQKSMATSQTLLQADDALLSWAKAMVWNRSAGLGLVKPGLFADERVLDLSLLLSDASPVPLPASALPALLSQVGLNRWQCEELVRCLKEQRRVSMLGGLFVVYLERSKLYVVDHFIIGHLLMFPWRKSRSTPGRWKHELYHLEITMPPEVEKLVTEGHDIILRPSLAGDYVLYDGLHRKRVVRRLQDRKVPQHHRIYYPVFTTKDNEQTAGLVWLPQWVEKEGG